MSDLSPGAGWWLASDGKWYAPHLHPDALRAASEDVLPTFSEVSVPGIGQPHGAGTPSTFFAGAPSDVSPSGFGQPGEAGRSTTGRARWAMPVVGLLVLIAAITGGVVFVTSGKSSPAAIQSPAEANSALDAAALAPGRFTTRFLHGHPRRKGGRCKPDRERGSHRRRPIHDEPDRRLRSCHQLDGLDGANAAMVESSSGYSTAEAASLAADGYPSDPQTPLTVRLLPT